MTAGAVIDLRGDETDPLATAVFVCLGAASTCREDLSGTGVFQSDRAKAIGDELVAFIERRYVLREAPPNVGEAAGEDAPKRAATVDREAVAGMTVAEVCDRRLDAVQGDSGTAGDSAELDYTQDLTVALDEELAELRAQRAELEKLREFARQVAALDDNDLDFAAREKLTELAEDLDLGWEARA